MHSLRKRPATHDKLESLDSLTEITARLFSSIPNRGLAGRPLITEDPWTEDQRRVGKLIPSFPTI